MAKYDDGRIGCTDQGLIIRHYYLPVGNREISYAAIREVRKMPLWLMGKVCICGSYDSRRWFNFDPQRPEKDVALVIHLGGWIRPVITPDDPDKVTAELKKHGVRIVNGSGPGRR